MDTTDLNNKRVGLISQMRSIIDTAAKAGRSVLTADEETKYEAMQSDVDALAKTIKRVEALATTEKQLADQRDGSYRPAAIENLGEPARKGRYNFNTDTKEYRAAFDDYFVNKRFSNVLQTGIDADGGFLCPTEYEKGIIKLQYNLDPMRRLATVKSSRSYANLATQTGGVTAGWIDELGTYPVGSPTLGQVSFSAFKNGVMIFATDEEIQDAQEDIAGFIAETGAQAMTDLESESFLVGNGAKKPLGIFNTTSVGGISVAGVTGGVSATAAITFDNLIDVQHALPRAYRDKATWLTSDAMVKLLRKVKDSNGLYIWQPSVVVGNPDTIFGRPVEVSDYATDPAVSAKSLIFGDLKAYHIRDRLGMQVKRLDERYAELGKVAWRFTKRVDARLTNANAIATFTHGAAA